MAFNNIYIELVEKAYEILSSDGGELYFQLPIYCKPSMWLNTLRGNGFNVTADTPNGTMKVVKEKNSPPKLVVPMPQDFMLEMSPEDRYQETCEQ